MKTNKPVAFRPTREVSELLKRLESVPAVNRSAVLNAAMQIGLPRALDELARDAQQLGERN